MKRLIPVILLALNACATIGPEHADLAQELEAGFARREAAYGRLVDRFEQDSRDRIDERMQFKEGPVIMKHAIKRTNFKEKVCEIEGELDQATELLKFTMAASRSYERVRSKYIRGLEKLVAGLRSQARREYADLRAAAAALVSGLRAYVKDKSWRKDMMKRLNVPVDSVDALNKAALEFDKMLGVTGRGD